MVAASPRHGVGVDRLNAFDGLDAMRSDYAAARESRYVRRRHGLPAGGASADYHVRSEGDYLRMMELARDMVRNDQIVGPAVQKLLTNVLQDGFTPDPQTGDDDVNLALRDRWSRWCCDPRACDLAGQLTFRKMEYQVLGSFFTDGDIFGLPQASGEMELVEAHRCRTPRNTKLPVVHGVKLDPATRRRLAYWFTRDNIDPMAALNKVGDVRQVPALDDDGEPLVFHVYDPLRVSQTRGITALAPIFSTLSMFEDINFAKMVQQQSVSSWAMLIERNRDFTPGAAAAGAKTGERRNADDPDGEGMIKQIGPGMIFRPRVGEKVSGFSPNVPNQEYFSHVKLMLQLVGIHLKLPLVLLLMDASETNFSGWRGAVDQARMEFRRVQDWMTDTWHSPVWRWKVSQWLAEDAALRRLVAASKVDPAATLKHRWNKPRWPYIQPLQDAQAQALRVQTRQTSPSRSAAELGADYDDLVTEIVKDNGQLIEAALERRAAIQEKYPGVELDWHELLYVPTADTLKGKLMEVKADAA